MKRLLVHIVFLITCFYFLSAGNMYLFSKIGKSNLTEVCDIDEDIPGKEGKDNKEDGCDEDTFLNIDNTLLLSATLISGDLFFIEKTTFIPQYVQEKNAPPPKV